MGVLVSMLLLMVESDVVGGGVSQVNMVLPLIQTSEGEPPGASKEPKVQGLTNAPTLFVQGRAMLSHISCVSKHDLLISPEQLKLHDSKESGLSFANDVRLDVTSRSVVTKVNAVSSQNETNCTAATVQNYNFPVYDANPVYDNPFYNYLVYIITYPCNNYTYKPMLDGFFSNYVISDYLNGTTSQLDNSDVVPHDWWRKRDRWRMMDSLPYLLLVTTLIISHFGFQYFWDLLSNTTSVTTLVEGLARVLPPNW